MLYPYRTDSEVMKAASADYHSAMVKLAAQDIRNGLTSIAEAIQEHADAR